jgi:SAM-dependent methyltransferase
MKRQGLHRPTIEDVVEISGIETLHPGGFPLTRRTAELAGLRPGLHVLDVSSGRGTQSLFYAREFGVTVTGIDIAPAMVAVATEQARREGLDDRVRFQEADSQALPFPDDHFDVVINECAVGIPDDSQRVLDEMVRVARPGAKVLIHESIWLGDVTSDEKAEIAERYGTTPLELDEWVAMLEKAGLTDVVREHEEWSRPERFWEVRKDRAVPRHTAVLSLPEKVVTAGRIARAYGLRGVAKAFENEREFYGAVLAGKLGYCLYRGVKPE